MGVWQHLMVHLLKVGLAALWSRKDGFQEIKQKMALSIMGQSAGKRGHKRTVRDREESGCHQNISLNYWETDLPLSKLIKSVKRASLQKKLECLILSMLACILPLETQWRC